MWQISLFCIFCPDVLETLGATDLERLSALGIRLIFPPSYSLFCGPHTDSFFAIALQKLATLNGRGKKKISWVDMDGLPDALFHHPFTKCGFSFFSCKEKKNFLGKTAQLHALLTFFAKEGKKLVTGVVTCEQFMSSFLKAVGKRENFICPSWGDKFASFHPHLSVKFCHAIYFSLLISHGEKHELRTPSKHHAETLDVYRATVGFHRVMQQIKAYPLWPLKVDVYFQFHSGLW